LHVAKYLANILKQISALVRLHQIKTFCILYGLLVGAIFSITRAEAVKFSTNKPEGKRPLRKAKRR
jgi:hypothetical protein